MTKRYSWPLNNAGINPCMTSVSMVPLHPQIQPTCSILVFTIEKYLCISGNVKFKQASQVGLVVKNLPANAGDAKDESWIPGLGRSPGGGLGNPLQYYCLGNSMDRGAWWATVHSVARSQTQLRDRMHPAQQYKLMLFKGQL